jgi:capsular exopolysaccharide synthesis family protein
VDGVDLKQYAIALRKGWWIILLSVILGTGAGALVNYRATPEYASTVTFFISTPTEGGSSALAADQFATRRITSYVGLLSSDVTAQRVIEETGLNMTVGDVRSHITGDADLNTVLLTATVTDSSPEQSLAIAQAVATQFGSIVNQVDPIGPENVVLRVISGPTLNPVPVSPRIAINLAGGFAIGLMIGVVIALLRQMLDNTVRAPQFLRTLTDAPVLGVIPYERASKKSPVIVESHARSLRAEAFRQLRTNLQFIDVERSVRVLVVTSSVADEGKSTTAANLAVTFADSGRRVLLIEADLRRPRVADYLGLERAVGLTNLLAGQVSLDDVLQPWGRTGLVVIPSGSLPPNPSELLGSPRMLDLLEVLKTRFDIIVIDTPPLLPVTDAAVAAAGADGAVLVVRHGKTTRSHVSAAVRSLRTVDARLLGTVLNMTPLKGTDGYESYGYGYYEADPAKMPTLEQVEQAANNGAPRAALVSSIDQRSPSEAKRRPRRSLRMKPEQSS